MTGILAFPTGAPLEKTGFRVYTQIRKRSTAAAIATEPPSSGTLGIFKIQATENTTE
jgi:hypothetical protein